MKRESAQYQGVLSTCQVMTRQAKARRQGLSQAARCRAKRVRVLNELTDTSVIFVGPCSVLGTSLQHGDPEPT